MTSYKISDLVGRQIKIFNDFEEETVVIRNKSMTKYTIKGLDCVYTTYSKSFFESCVTIIGDKDEADIIVTKEDHGTWVKYGAVEV